MGGRGRGRVRGRGRNTPPSFPPYRLAGGGRPYLEALSTSPRSPAFPAYLVAKVCTHEVSSAHLLPLGWPLGRAHCRYRGLVAPELLGSQRPQPSEIRDNFAPAQLTCGDCGQKTNEAGYLANHWKRMHSSRLSTKVP